jgi:hypothetical protein
MQMLRYCVLSRDTTDVSVVDTDTLARHTERAASNRLSLAVNICINSVSRLYNLVAAATANAAAIATATAIATAQLIQQLYLPLGLLLLTELTSSSPLC